MVSQKITCLVDHVVEIRIMRWICGHIRSDKIRNEDIQNKVRVTFMVDKMREARPRWFRYVKRR